MSDAPPKRLFTDTDMHNNTMRDEIEEFYNHLQRLIDNDQLSIPSKNYDLVLDIMGTEDERISWSYYYACHDARCLFWLEMYDASYMISEVFGVKSPAHVSALHFSRVEFPEVSINVVRRASFGGPLLVRLPSTGLVL
jgi:hypothetical protein